MGLLGTVTGMIRSFDILSISEGQPFAITGGVAEALVATGVGAIFYTHFRAHETKANLVCRLLLGKKKKKKGSVDQRRGKLRKTDTLSRDYTE